MTKGYIEPVKCYKTDLKSKGGLLRAIIASQYGIPVVSSNTVQQEYLNRVFNHAKYTRVAG